MCASSDEPASFFDSLQLRLDPTLSPGVRATLFQDVAKRAPAATRDAVSSACAAVGSAQNLAQVIQANVYRCIDVYKP